jgi:hypothetical protein
MKILTILLFLGILQASRRKTRKADEELFLRASLPAEPYRESPIKVLDVPEVRLAYAMFCGEKEGIDAQVHQLTRRKMAKVAMIFVASAALVRLNNVDSFGEMEESEIRQLFRLAALMDSIVGLYTVLFRRNINASKLIFLEVLTLMIWTLDFGLWFLLASFFPYYFLSDISCCLVFFLISASLSSVMEVLSGSIQLRIAQI